MSLAYETSGFWSVSVNKNLTEKALDKHTGSKDCITY